MLEALTVAVDESSVWLLVAKGKQRLFYRSGVSSEDPQVRFIGVTCLGTEYVLFK